MAETFNVVLVAPAVSTHITVIHVDGNAKSKVIVVPNEDDVPDPNWQKTFCVKVVVITRLEPLDNEIKLADDNCAYADKLDTVAYADKPATVAYADKLDTVAYADKLDTVAYADKLATVAYADKLDTVAYADNLVVNAELTQPEDTKPVGIVIRG